MGIEPISLADPLIRPNVELLDVDGFESKISQAFLGASDDMI
jgi:hypothetical protein